MNKQVIIGLAALASVLLIFIFGKTAVPLKPFMVTPSFSESRVFSIDSFITSKERELTPDQQLYISHLEKIVRGDVNDQRIKSYESLASFWKDSARAFEPYAWYSAKAAKLENSSKNLNFAGQLFLNGIRSERDPAKINWYTAEAVELFEKAIALEPSNDEYKVGLGSAYIFGNANNSDPQRTMHGIQELLSVVNRDSTNMHAQLVLGIGGLMSGQYEKAIQRLEKVVGKEPENAEAVAFLADAYAAKGDKENAIRWYEVSKKLINNAAYSREADQRIENLKAK